MDNRDDASIFHSVAKRTPAPPPPCAWLQWKGTNACMDVWCTCGDHAHVDADYAYFYECSKCGAKFLVSGYVALVPLTEAEIALHAAGNYVPFVRDVDAD